MLKLIIIKTKNSVHAYKCVDYTYNQLLNYVSLLTSDEIHFTITNVKDVIVRR